MPLSPSAARDLIGDEMLPALADERRRLDQIDRWYRWDHDGPSKPRHATREHEELADRAQTPWLNLVVTSVAQALYVEGYRSSGAVENARPWNVWQTNGLDSRQLWVHRSALAYGDAYVVVLPGSMIDGSPMPKLTGVSPRNLIAFWNDPADDEWPVYALRTDPTRFEDGKRGWMLRLYDDEREHRFTIPVDGTTPTYVEFREHNAGVCPVARFANQLDLEGRTNGEVEPFISVAARIDQTTYDRLVVQRFSSWVVRTISGMAKPEGDEEAAAKRLRLMVEDILIAEDPDTKFGSLPATSLDPFVKAKDADIRDLAAVTQTPPHHLLGQMANLSAEALAAAEASLSRKVEERKHSFGESWEQVLRLSARLQGDEEGASDIAAEVRWRDMESRSLAQTADALGKLAQMLGVPVEMLWEKIPGWTDQDLERAKNLRAMADPFAVMAAELERQAADIDLSVPPPLG